MANRRKAGGRKTAARSAAKTSSKLSAKAAAKPAKAAVKKAAAKKAAPARKAAAKTTKAPARKARVKKSTPGTGGAKVSRSTKARGLKARAKVVTKPVKAASARPAPAKSPASRTAARGAKVGAANGRRKGAGARTTARASTAGRRRGAGRKAPTHAPVYGKDAWDEESQRGGLRSVPRKTTARRRPKTPPSTVSDHDEYVYEPSPETPRAAEGAAPDVETGETSSAVDTSRPPQVPARSSTESEVQRDAERAHAAPATGEDETPATEPASEPAEVAPNDTPADADPGESEAEPEDEPHSPDGHKAAGKLEV